MAFKKGHPYYGFEENWFKKGNTWGRLNKGRKYSKKTIQRMSEGAKRRIKRDGNLNSPFVKGHIPWNKGLKGEEYKKHFKNGFKHISELNRKKLKEKNPAWRGGRSFIDYGKEWVKIRNKIRKNQCERCGNNENLMVHHKDFNKRNNSLENLMTVCRSCHTTIHNLFDN